MATHYEAKACAAHPKAYTWMHPLTHRPPLIASAIGEVCLKTLYELVSGSMRILHASEQSCNCRSFSLADCPSASMTALRPANRAGRPPPPPPGVTLRRVCKPRRTGQRTKLQMLWQLSLRHANQATLLSQFLTPPPQNCCIPRRRAFKPSRTVQHTR